MIGSEEIDLHRPAYDALRDVEEVTDRHHTRVVHEDIKAAHGRLGVVEERPERLGVGDVEWESGDVLADRRGGLLGDVEVDVADRHRCPTTVQLARRREADATSCAGDGDALACQGRVTHVSSGGIF